MTQTTPRPGKTPGETAGAEANELALIETLTQAATAIGVQVRFDKLASGDVKATSGVCRIRGVDTVIIDRRLSPKERIAALTRELAQFNFDEVYLPPAARELINPTGQPNREGDSTHEKT